MNVILYLLALVASGLLVGALARLALPGRDPMSLGMTILIGITGSFLAGLAVYAISGEAHGGGLLLSIAVATLLVYLVRRSQGRGLHSDRWNRGRA